MGDFEKLSGFKSSLTPKEPTFAERYYWKPFQIGLTTDSVAVVIDGHSLNACCRAIEHSAVTLPRKTDRLSVDFKELYNVLLANFPVLRRVYYVTSERLVPNDDGTTQMYSPIRAMLDWMRYNNYLVTSVPFETSADGSHRNKDHESMVDVEITTALFRASEIADHIVFFGSNKKFSTPLQLLFKEKNKLVTVVSTNLEGSRVVHDSLRQIGSFVEMGDPDLLELIASRNTTPRNFIPQVGTLKETA